MIQTNSNEGQNSRPPIGGWRTQLSGSPQVIVGYCIEKITNGFQVLRRITKWEEELNQTTRRQESNRPSYDRQQRKLALSIFKKAINSFKKEQDLNALKRLAENDELIEALPFAEKGLLFLIFIQRNGSNKKNNQNIALNVASSASDSKELIQLLELAGGRALLERTLHKDILGRYLCLLERFELERWCPPYENQIFTKSDEGSDEEQEQIIDVFEPLIDQQYKTRFLNGEITASKIFGLSKLELYQIADRAYRMMQAGKLKEALQIFDALVYLEPNDAYFYTALGSVQQQQGDFDGALFCYEKAIALQSENISSIANRGEIFFLQGKLSDALNDFQKVLELDPEAMNPSTVRVRLLLTQLREALYKKEKAN
jgi:tetratricopeptide (TPR) repeat protein